VAGAAPERPDDALAGDVVLRRHVQHVPENLVLGSMVSVLHRDPGADAITEGTERALDLYAESLESAARRVRDLRTAALGVSPPG
jgi:hypothetical protein